MRFDFERNNAYVVKKGDSLYNIAKKYGVTVDSLIKANGLDSALIYPNQVLIIPMNNQGDIYFVEYIVREDDSLNSIANKYDVTVDDIANYNDLGKLYLVMDQTLQIPKKYKTHEVVTTDSIDYILKKYDMTLEEFVELNKGKLLKVGTTIIVK